VLEQRLRDEPQWADFRLAFARYLEQWGFRSSGELMLTRPSPEEDARPTLELLRSYAQMDAPSPHDQLAEQAAAREAATEDVYRQVTPNAVLRRLPSSRAWQLRRLLAATHGAIRLRERARQKQAKLYVRLRHIARAIGERLVASGHLALTDDVFFLTCEEVDALLGDAAMAPPDVHRLVRDRHVEHARLAAMAPPDSFTLGRGERFAPAMGGPSPGGAADDADTGTSMHGTGACGGRIVGTAAVLADATEAGRMQQGDIVVTRQTDPGWACVFFLARGLVVERGGMLSHGAIIARELGIPAVVGVRHATRRIAHGVRLSVDGDRGVVDLLS
jgi:pyruvate,water dikinase